MKRTNAYGVLGLAVIISGAPALSAAEPADWTQVAQELVTRRVATDEGVVDYRTYSFQLEQYAFDDLSSLLLAGQSPPDPQITERVETWMEANLPETVGAMRGWCAFEGDLWQDNKKVMEADTMYESAVAAALQQDATAVPPPAQVRTHSDGVTETTIEENRVVRYKDAPTHLHAMAPVDVSLFRWQTAIDQGAPAGQVISATIDGSLHTILIESEDPNAPMPVRVRHDFDQDLDFAPLRATFTRGGQTQMDHLFAYSDDGGDAPARPAVSLRGERLPDGRLQVTLWIVESWQEWTDAEWLVRRLPPYRLTLDYRDEPDPLLVIERPGYLDDVAAQDWVRVTMQRILDKWGTYDPETDYNCDGVIDDKDTDAALAVLSQKPEREHP